METPTAAAAPAAASRESKPFLRKRRLELRAANLAATARGGPPPGLGKLDPSLKKHTSLLIKLRSSLCAPSTLAPLLKELATLSLDKHIEEITSASLEGLSKAKTGADVATGVEVCSCLHQRFPDQFTPSLVAGLLASLKSTSGAAAGADKEAREKEEQARVARQRGLLRVLGECEAVGLCVGKAGQVGELSWGALKELLTADKDALATSAPIAIAFTKHLGSIYLPPPSSTPASAEHDFPSLPSATTSGTESESEEIVSREMKDKFRKLLLAYLDALGRREVKASLDLQARDKRNHEAYIRSGEVFEDREKGYEKAVRAWERGWASVTQLSELLGLPVPALPSLAATASASVLSGVGSSFATNGEEFGVGGIWQDEEEKKFYEDVRELRGEVPGSVLGVAKDDDKKDEPLPPIAEDVKDEDEPTTEAVEPISEDSAAIVAEAVEALPAGPAAQLTALFARLPEASSRTSIDACAVEFAFLNSKATRKRLVKFLASVNRNRQDILPYYARLVGTLDPYMPDVGKELVALLEDEFRYLQRKKHAEMSETRSKNLRFLAELTKFKVTPLHAILHVFKVILDDFSGPNIENLCTLLEGCGRFLIRSESSKENMRAVIDVVKRKKAAMNLDPLQMSILENALYQSDPPERPAIPPKVRTPMVQYIRHLFYTALTRNSRDKVLKLLRKLDWDDPTVQRKLYGAFTKVWKIKFSNVHLFAVLLWELGRWHEQFKVRVVDAVLENVRTGMEHNSFKLNQQRIATIKYLGEMYIYRVVDSKLIFDSLWTLVTFGHPEGRPNPDRPSEIDSPDDCFRIRLICVLLDTCGSCFDKGALRKRLDEFLTFFGMYIASKGQLPMDVDFMLSDTIEQLRPQMKLPESYYDAAIAVEAMYAEKAKAEGGAHGARGAEAEAEEEGELEENDERRAELAEELEEEEANEAGDGSDDDSSDSSSSSSSGSDSDDGDEDEEEEEDEGRMVVDPNAPTQEEDDEFTRELSKMMTASGVSSDSRPKNGLAEVGVPILRRQKPDERERERPSLEGEDAPAPEGMRFTLLTKKGSKQQTVSMNIPLESAIAIHTLEKREKDKLEQQQMKRLVLDYESRAEVEQKHQLRADLARRGINLTFINKNGSSRIG